MRKLCIGLSMSATWLRGDAWRRPDSRVEKLHDLAFQAELARKAEAVKLDFIFCPDALYLMEDALRQGPGFSGSDPTMLLAALIGATQRIGLVTTVSTSFIPPYVIARQIHSLDLLSRGRAGWNVVTSIDGAANFGATEMPDAARRYEMAAEVTDLVRALWNSYPADAVLHDRSSGEYADAARVKPVNHNGKFHQVRGPLNVPGFGDGDIPLFQAGASGPGRNFAARIADAIFAASPDIPAGRELRDDLRRRAAGLGRNPDMIRVLPGLSFYLANSDAEARDLFRAAHAHQNEARLLAVVQQVLGVDLRDRDPDQPITSETLPPPQQPVRSRTHTELLHAYIARESPSLRQLMARPEVMESAHWVVVGTPATAVEAIIRRMEAGAMDGLIALPGGSLGSLDLFLTEVVPALAERRLFRKEYKGTTLRSHLESSLPH